MNQNVNHDFRGTQPCLRHIVSKMCLVFALDSYLFAMSAWCLQKQVKNNAGKKERRVAVILTPFSSSKCLLIDGQKSFFWLMISIYEICKSHAKSFARIESAWCMWKKYYGVKTALHSRAVLTLEFAGVEVLQSRKVGHISSFLLIG